MLKINLFGQMTAEIDAAPLRFETRKVAALLAYLIFHPGGNRREKLAALFWPDFDAVHAMANLRRALGSLIHTLPPGYVLADRETICWDEPGPLNIDVRDFQDGLRAVRGHTADGVDPCDACLERLEALAALYRADFLDDLTLPDCPEFDEWQNYFREDLRREFAWALEKLASSWSARSNWEKAAETARRWVWLDRLDARAHLNLTAIYAQSGQRSLAQRQSEAYARLIQNEFNQEPGGSAKGTISSRSERGRTASKGSQTSPAWETGSGSPFTRFPDPAQNQVVYPPDKARPRPPAALTLQTGKYPKV